jgi:phosphohistidine phosphatase
VPSVKIDEGRHKYVQIRASIDGEERVFVTSKRGAHYHRNAAEPLIDELERAGYHDVEVTGGGRIELDARAKRISIYGYSYGFGLADHGLSKSVIMQDPRYRDYEITTSNEGY